jgi:hypothetical protein
MRGEMMMMKVLLLMMMLMAVLLMLMMTVLLMMMNWRKRPHEMCVQLKCERDVAGREGHCVEGLVSMMTVLLLLLLLLLMMTTTTMTTMMTIMPMQMAPTTLMFEMHHQ